jgi:hypothetical protein
MEWESRATVRNLVDPEKQGRALKTAIDILGKEFMLLHN